jgi:hypothetical protein
MARILTAGNEMGDWAGDGFTIYAGSPGESANSRYVPPTPQNNSGRWSIQLTNGQGLQYDIEPTNPGGLDEFYVRFHFHAGFRSDGTWERFRFLTSTGVVLAKFVTAAFVTGVPDGGRWYPRVYNSANGLLISGSDNNTRGYRNSDWQLIEFYFKFSPTAGRTTMWINEEKVFDVSGNITGPGNETLMRQVAPYYAVVSGGGAGTPYYDDIAINDLTGVTNNGRCGRGWVVPMWPSGNGTTSNLTNSFGTSVDNFKFINKRLIDNPSGIVATSVANDKDTYSLPEVPTEFQGVNAIRVTGYGVRNGPSITKAKMIVKPPAQAEIDLPSGVGVGVLLPAGGPDYFHADFDNNPNTSDEPFTRAELDGMEAGIQFIA